MRARIQLTYFVDDMVKIYITQQINKTSAAVVSLKFIFFTSAFLKLIFYLVLNNH